MSDTGKGNKIMLTGGILLFAVAGVFFYLAKNPEVLSKWQYERDSARRAEMQQILLKAPESCADGRVEIFSGACDYLDDGAGSTWLSQLSTRERDCLTEGHRTTGEFKLEFDGDPVDHMEHMMTDEDIVLHACLVSGDADYYLKDVVSADAQAFLDNWYQWKYDEGNYFN